MSETLKTAKEVCEQVKINQKLRFDEQIAYFIDLVLESSGKYSSGRNTWNESLRSEIVLRLQELGYKYEELKWQSTKSERVIVYSNWFFKLIGLSNRIKWAEIPGKEYIYFTISACCGEEQENV